MFSQKNIFLLNIIRKSKTTIRQLTSPPLSNLAILVLAKSMV